MGDDLGDRMKDWYEKPRTNEAAMPLLPLYARIDGKGFSGFTRDMDRPFDAELSEIMVETTKFLVAETHAKLGYTQSDEISLVWYVDDPKSEYLFGGKFQKMTSILASMATTAFYPRAAELWPDLVKKLPPMFDCRVFQLPSLEEAANAVLWREIDATKNAVSMACRAYYSHRDMHGKGSSDMQEMLFQKGVNFNDYPPAFKRGTFVRRVTREVSLDEETLARIPPDRRPTEPVLRSRVERLDMPPFRKVLNRVGVIFRGEEPITA